MKYIKNKYKNIYLISKRLKKDDVNVMHLLGEISPYPDGTIAYRANVVSSAKTYVSCYQCVFRLNKDNTISKEYKQTTKTEYNKGITKAKNNINKICLEIE